MLKGTDYRSHSSDFNFFLVNSIDFSRKRAMVNNRREHHKHVDECCIVRHVVKTLLTSHYLVAFRLPPRCPNLESYILPPHSTCVPVLGNLVKIVNMGL